MKNLATILIFTFFLSLSAVAQMRLTGTVVEVIDGKTFVLETSSGKTTAQLQYIDVPEPEQALHKTVNEHLRALVVGKTAEFSAASMAPNKLIGRLTVNGVDVGMQMLRDGAAWLVPHEKTGQSTLEYASYQEYETAAKSDHLGVWSVPGLKPAWIVRAEKQQQSISKGTNATAKPSQQMQAKRNVTSQFQTISNPYAPQDNGKILLMEKDLWLDVLAGTGVETPGIKTFSEPSGRFNVLYTSAAFVNLASGNIKQRVECRAAQVDLTINGERKTVHLIGFRGISDDYNFSKHASRLTLTIDGKSTSIALFTGLRGRASFGALEMMFYPVSPATLKRIAAAKNVTVKIDKLTGPMDKNLQSLIGQLAAGI